MCQDNPSCISCLISKIDGLSTKIDGLSTKLDVLDTTVNTHDGLQTRLKRVETLITYISWSCGILFCAAVGVIAKMLG